MSIQYQTKRNLDKGGAKSMIVPDRCKEHGEDLKNYNLVVQKYCIMCRLEGKRN